MSFAEWLAPEQVQRTHLASLEILDGVGMAVHLEQAREILAKNGCRVPAGDGPVTFPTGVVERFMAFTPPTFTFRGRTPDLDRTLPKDAPVIVTGSSAPDLVDPDTGKIRRAKAADVGRIARLIDALPAHDVFSISTLADDAPADAFTVARLLPALRHCSKPIRVTTRDMADFDSVIRLLTAVAGSEAAYRQRPFVTHHYCPVVSPLTFDRLSTEALIRCCAEDRPVYPSIVPNAGLTSPMSMAGTLAQGNAEFLAVTTLMQMVRPGTPTIYATLPTVADLRSGAYASGGIECGMLHMAFAQLARFYNVPCGGYIGLTNSKINDAQSGWETGMSATAGVLGGAHMLNMSGMLDALKAFDFAKAVIDDEIGSMLKRLHRGIAFDERDLALDVIAEVGPGGSFMMEEHTAERMRTESVMTHLADREPRPVWESKGSPDAHTRALRKALEIINDDRTAPFPPEIESRIQAAFPGL